MGCGNIPPHNSQGAFCTVVHLSPSPAVSAEIEGFHSFFLRALSFPSAVPLLPFTIATFTSCDGLGKQAVEENVCKNSVTF